MVTATAIDWSEAELDAWQLPAEIPVSEWADKNRVLDPKTSAEPGNWSTDRTPYLREIMDSFTETLVEQITFCKATQIGGTEAAYNMLGFVVDQAPGPTLMVYPTEPIARSVSQNRVQPMFRLSKALRRRVPAKERGFDTLEYKLDRMLVNWGWAGSPAVLAQMARRYLIMDEIDKFPKFSGREADPIKLATERARTFWNRKIVLTSTPTTKQGYIWREYGKSDQRKYHVPCPHCGMWQILVFGQIKFPEDERDADKIEADRLAWYECSACEKRITDKHKARMVAAGKWVPEGGEIDKHGNVKLPKGTPNPNRGYWLNCLCSPWLTFSEIAAEFLRSKDYPELLQNFVNSWLAEPWEELIEENEPDTLRSHATQTGAGVVPDGAKLLTAGVDVQKDHFYFVIRGWGYFEESWLVLAQRCESWEALNSILFATEYPYESGRRSLEVNLACIDSGYRTDEVYEVARHYGERCRAIKGNDHLAGPCYRSVIIDRHPITGEALRGGLRLWHIDTTYLKDKLARLVSSEPGAPGNWHLHAEPDEEYLKQFCAERKVIQRNRKTGATIEEWQPTSAGAANHYLDCEVYAAGAAQMRQVGAMRKDEGDGRQVHRPEPRPARKNDWVSGSRGRRGGWIGRK